MSTEGYINNMVGAPGNSWHMHGITKFPCIASQTGLVSPWKKKHAMFRQTLNDIVVSSVVHPAKNEIVTIILKNKNGA